LEASFCDLLFLDLFVIELIDVALLAVDNVVGVINHSDLNDITWGWVDELEELITTCELFVVDFACLAKFWLVVFFAVVGLRVDCAGQYGPAGFVFKVDGVMNGYNFDDLTALRLYS
jgi:hypothetical protein